MAEPALSIVETPARPEVVEQVVLLPVDQIDATNRLRPIDPDWAASLRRLMEAHGQDEAIWVCQLPGRSDWKLIAGGHRHAAAIIGEWSHIRAIVKSADAIERRRQEVSENLWRKGLPPQDRAAFVAELLDLLKAKAGIDANASPQSIAANARWQKALKSEAGDASAEVARAYGLADQVAEEFGLSRRSIYGALELHRRLLPDVAAFARTLIPSPNAAQLGALARQPDELQRRAIHLIQTGKAKGLGDAIALVVGKARPSPDAKRLSAFLGAYQRMGRAERAGALEALAGLPLPKGWSIQHG